MKKYEFTDKTIIVLGRTFYRIRALKDFGDVREGDLGGFVECEENLAQDGNAWVYGNARVFGNAQVFGDAWVYGDAQVFGDAQVYGNAWVFGDARVFGDAQVYGDAWVYGNARVFGDAWVYGNAQVYGNARVFGNAQVYGNAWVFGDAQVYGNDNIFWISNIGSRAGTTTFFACQDKTIRVSCGCFFGDLEEFDAKVRQTHGDSRHGNVYRTAIEMAKAHIVIPEEEP